MARDSITWKTELACGYTSHSGLKQIVVRLDPARFAELKARAIKERVSMNTKLVQYVEVGLAVDDEWDEDEPERHARRDKRNISC